MNNKVTVEIWGVKYPLRYTKDSDINDIQEAAKIVDENIRLIAKQNQYLPPDRVAILTALQLAEQLIRLKKDYNEFWDILDENRSNKHK
ncbi:cell division protein ZapA [Megamonas rupellensis]|uniref:cell division protein ZapA n=1 Tax=Megamonas rupellensis TaxID=491921 RepID=UPI001956808D|nr:cell division protein ZapA [Megamonas rupellensis]MBM6749275.1 cell division protein ZapA [Megamonas rupellensis]